MTTRPCGCCEGVQKETPAGLYNRPGLSALAYRVGTHGAFLRSMQTALRGESALRDLTAETDDPSLALLDAWAVTLDVLSFYQDRIADEHYLRTATERRSILELARQIGYELRPGVAAGTFLAFTVESAPGAPHVAEIPVGTRAQSVPGQDEKPQPFETVEAIHAEAAWNAMRARTREPFTPGMRSTTLYLEGVATGLQPGDGLLLVGTERAGDAGSERWDFRRVKSLTTDRDLNLTTVVLDEPLGSALPFVRPAAAPVVYAMRTKASPFGHNAPDWRAMPDEMQEKYDGSREDEDWPGLTLTSITGDRLGRTLFLDRLYKEIVPDSWIVVATPEYAEVYRVDGVVEDARTGFTLSGKSTRLTISGEGLIERFDDAVREMVIYGASEALPQALRPVTTDVSGNVVLLAEKVEGLGKGRLIAVTGLDAATGRAVAEIVEVEHAEAFSGTTRLTFKRPLQHAYGRDSVRFNANVARATHGETRTEVLGSGSGAAAFQRFDLKNKPLTYVSAPTPSGLESTLEVRVDGIRWDEVPTLYAQPPAAEIYTTRRADEGETTVQFGDGETGARLPTGYENVRATYRVGSGLEGLVDAGQISLLSLRPLGVKAVTNPLPSSGADEPEVLEDARDNAPLTVLTLDRAVSLRDVESFARAFPGIGKAQVARLWSGESRFVYVTVAGVNGSAVAPLSDTYEHLKEALLGAWHEAETIRIASYEARAFGIEATLTTSSRHVQDDVLAAARAALLDAFSFSARALGQGVTAGEVMAVLQGVEGVVAVDLDRLGGLDALVHPRLIAQPARYSSGTVRPAQLLTLDPAAITLRASDA